MTDDSRFPQARRSPSSRRPLPSGDRPGWRRVLAEDFTRPVPVGGFVADASGTLTPAGAAGHAAYGPGPAGRTELRCYPDGWPTTHRNGVWAPSRTLSVRTDVDGADGVLDIHHHTAAPPGHTGAPEARPLGAVAWFPLPAFDGAFRIGPYLLIEYRARSHGFAPGAPTHFHGVPLLIDSRSVELWRAGGELNWFEADLRPDGPVAGWYHRADPAGSKERVAGPPGAVLGDWHVYTIEWSPGRVRFGCDGHVCLDTTTMTPTVPLAFLIQSEPVPPGPDPATEGHLQIDWITVHRYIG